MPAAIVGRRSGSHANAVKDKAWSLPNLHDEPFGAVTVATGYSGFESGITHFQMLDEGAAIKLVSAVAQDVPLHIALFLHR